MGRFYPWVAYVKDPPRPRAGIKDILSKENRRNVDEVKPEYVKGLRFHYVDDVREVLDLALMKEKVKNPKRFTIPTKEKVSKDVS